MCIIYILKVNSKSKNSVDLWDVFLRFGACLFNVYTEETKETILLGTCHDISTHFRPLEVLLKNYGNWAISKYKK